jgi:hypothetical protein
MEQLERATFHAIKRRCTDVLFLFLFLALTAATGYSAYMIISHAQANYINYGMDSQGNFCGLTPGYESYPYAFYSNIETANWLPYAVCIQSCPSHGFDYLTLTCVGTPNVPAVNG